MIHTVTKAVQDKVSPSHGRTMFNTYDGSINAIALKKDESQVVVAGRNVFKIISIEDDEFVEKVNLRVGKNVNLNFSASDVAWNHIEEHILASAATNGAVVIWNLNRTTQSKQDHVFMEHKRTVHSVSFHDSEGHLLLSGSQDGNMNLYDLRKKGISTTFSGKSESVRDVRFCPSSNGYFYFAAAYENGNVQIWDYRRPDKFEKQFTAHHGPVFTLDWHPDERNWLATGGRDKTVKVWDLNSVKVKHCVQTIAAVGKVRWRPQRKYHLASCSLLVDFSVNVWDIRRPFIPFAAFNQHTDVATGIIWKSDPHMFISCGKDSKLYQHQFNDAVRPADNAIPIGLDMNVHGDVTQAASNTLGGKAVKRNPIGPSSKVKLYFRKHADRSDNFINAHSDLYSFDWNDESLSMKSFIESARQYRLTGSTFEHLCDHNTMVARNLDQHQIAETWQLLKVLYSSAGTHTPAHVTRSMPITGGDRQERDAVKKSLEATLSNKSNDKTGGKTESKLASGLSDEESDEENSDDKNLANIASGLVNQNDEIFFDDSSNFTSCLEQDSYTSMSVAEDWVLQSEAFQPRHEIIARSPSPTQLQESPVSANESDRNGQVSCQDSSHEDNFLLANLLDLKLSIWNSTNLVVEQLTFFAQQGDVQTPVSMVIVLGERIRQHISEMTLENWFHNYIELLGHYKLWTIANLIIKLSNLPLVSMLNQQSTTVHTNCCKCSKALTRSGWLCDRCKALSSTCSVCHLPVKGLYVWCQGCSHGGHMQHMRDWIQQLETCPTGCGHYCQYS